MKTNKLSPFNINDISPDSAWLLGFIYSDSTIGDHLGKRVIRLFNKDKNLMQNIKKHFNIPYKVCKQESETTTVYFIRFADADFVSSIESLGFAKDRTHLKVPAMNVECTQSFILGFLKGKGSYFHETSGTRGFKVVYRSEKFINEIANLLSHFCSVRIHKPHYRLIKKHISGEIKYVGKEFGIVNNFISSVVSPWEQLKS